MSAVYQWEGMYPDGGETRGLSPCMECGLPHSPVRRRAVLRRMLPATSGEVLEAWPHLWSGTKFGRELLRRDLRELGAVSHGGEWSLP